MKKIMAVCALSATVFSASTLAQTTNAALNGFLANPGGANVFSMDNLLSFQNDLTQSFTNGSQAAPGLIAFGSAIQPLDTFAAGSGIGSSLGLGILTNTFPVVGVLTEDPTSLPDYLMNDGGIFSSFGFFSEFPAIPLFNAPIGGAPGGGMALPGLDGADGLDILLGGSNGFALPMDAISL